jgi:glutathione peroxidase
MKFSKHTGMAISIISNESKIKAPVSFYNLEATANNGQVISFENYRDKKVLLVNLASKCGFTPQYDELEKLQQIHKDKITILGFPSDDFGGQEPGSDNDIAEFCRINFGVTFQLYHKNHVKDLEKQPVYQWLCDEAKNGWSNNEPTWNFCKYLVDENGDLQKFFSSAVSPMDEVMLKAISL